MLPKFRTHADVKAIKLEIKAETCDESDDTSSVLHNGCFIDVEKLLDQLKRSEKAREKTEELLVDLRKNNTDLKASNTKAKDKIRDLEKEVKNCGRLLNDAEQSLSLANVCYHIHC